MLVTFDPLVSLSLTTARNFLKELNGEIAYKLDLKVNELIFCVLVSFNPLWPPLSLKLRVRSNLLKMQTGNCIRNLIKIGLEIKILDFGGSVTFGPLAYQTTRVTTNLWIYTPNKYFSKVFNGKKYTNQNSSEKSYHFGC